MIVPQYWSESKTKQIVDGKQFTVKRFGWSDVSELDAKAHADQRLDEALKELKENGNVRRIDHKVSYNGAEGIPIREEVVDKHDDIVISRNSYGALCLNTPDVFFADIDFKFEASTKFSFLVFIVLATIASGAAFIASSWLVLAITIFFSAVYSPELARKIHLSGVKKKGGFERESLENIQSLAVSHPELNLHVYKTPNGLRVLILNSTYSPRSATAIELLTKLDSDKTYIQMCKNQNCFRARLTPKPWRIGVVRLRPTPGVWPVKPEWLKDRSAWIKEYEEASRNYASCLFLTHFGSNDIDEKAAKVKKLHDELCRALHTELEIA